MILRLFKNTLASYGGQFIVVVTGLILTPFMIQNLGETGFGIWTLASSILAYFSLFDLGLGNALVKYTAEYAARHDQDTVNRMASTLLGIFSLLGLLALVPAGWLADNFNQFFTVPADSQTITWWVIFLLGVNFALGLPLSVFNALIVGYQRYDILNVISSLSLLLNAGLIILLLSFGGGLISVAIITLLITLVKPLGLMAAIQHWVAPAFAIRLGIFDRQVGQLLVSYSIFMFIIFACRQIEISTSNIIVGHFISVEEVTRYSVGVKLSGFLRNIMMPVTLIFFPAFAQLSAALEWDKTRQLFLQAMKVSLAIGAPAAGFMIVLAPTLIALWVGAQFVDSAWIAIVLIVQALVYQQLVIVGSLLQGIARLKVWTLLHIFVVIFNLAFSFALVGHWGSMAVALADLIAWLVVLVVALWYSSQILGVSVQTIVSEALFSPLLFSGGACLILYGMTSFLGQTNLFVLFSVCAAAGLLYLILYLQWGVKEEERQVLAEAAQKLLPRHQVMVK